jgi:hypothetical protein
MNSMHKSICELERITTDLVIPTTFQQVFQLVTVTYCCVVIQDKFPGDIKLDKETRQSFAPSLKCLCRQQETFRVTSQKTMIPPYLKNYIRYTSE